MGGGRSGVSRNSDVAKVESTRIPLIRPAREMKPDQGSPTTSRRAPRPVAAISTSRSRNEAFPTSA
jgi:hypothetical protein